jgi:thiol-disulfide isomerase/thioredoxin
MPSNTMPWCATPNAQPAIRSLERARRFAAASLLALAGVGASAHAAAPFMTPVEPARAAPSFTLKDIDGKTHTLAGYRGKVVLVNFWATWCPPCRAEMPSIEKLYTSMKGKPFVVLALDQGESVDNLFAFMGQLSPSPTFPVLLDAKSRTAHAFGVMGIPSTYLIDKQGRIVAQAIGGRDYDSAAMRTLLDRLMK